MRSVVVLAMVALVPAGPLVLPAHAVAQENVAVTNVEIRMVKSSTKGALRVTAETRNPNEFALRDVQFNCSIKDMAGKELASYASTIYEDFPAHQRKTTKNLNVGAWPPDGYAALCISARGVKVAAPAAGTN